MTHGPRRLPFWPLNLVGLWLAGCTVANLTLRLSELLYETRDAYTREAYRLVFFHVPLAWIGALAFIIAAAHSARYLLGRDLRVDAAAHAATELGLVFTVLATVTGMIFARTQWGTWWNWDPRQTSIFLVLLLYAAYLALRGTLPEDETLRARLSAAYLLAVAPMIWLVAVFPRANTSGRASLHPSEAPFDPIHWWLFFANFAGQIGLFVVLARLHDALYRLRRGRRRRGTEPEVAG